MTSRPVPVVDEATRRRELCEGFETLARLLAVTLGPTRGVVLNDVGGGSAESLVESATIARRITALPGRRRNAGAALLREMVRQVGRRYGDGGATAAVLATAILRHGRRSVAAGASPVRVREGIRLGVSCAGGALKDQATPVVGEADLAGLATAVTGDPDLGAAVGELLDVLGVDGDVVVEEHYLPGLAHDYVDGARWRGRPAQRSLLPGANTELTLLEPAVVVADLELTQADQVRPFLEAVRAMPDRPPLLLVAREVSGGAQTMCELNDRRGVVVTAPVAITTSRTHVGDDFADLALLTGATVVAPESGCPPERFRPEYLGRARRALVQAGYLTVSGGSGDRGEVCALAARLRTRAWELDVSRDAATEAVRDRLWSRQARLLGRVAALRVGAPTDTEREARRGLARKAVSLVRTALRDGVVAGGGVAYLDCVDAVRAGRERCPDPDRALGMAAVEAGLAAPFLQLVANAGRREPRAALEQVRGLGSGHGIDVLADRSVRMREAGIWDVAGVVAGALEAAGETAGLLVSAEVVSGRG
ncbi:TCP-1/cpn60 chaperonin family protein [Actinopolymorpha pittospori]|uniref:60 kDa chaperonin n=1 Tax=Actinopolymorpha pittospori TaxID=648752 RepID=A0A927N680_9ACTN|nr:TCP-1/cpn60 chaperonin family protein [Actinopolymorpha pittospori]MBE1611738.1 chaperonin GroEL [Actinopolymorpha pittospori]